MKRLFELVEKNLFLSNISKKFPFASKKNLIKPIITLSREFGSSGSIIAEKIAKKLGKKWKAYHSEIVNEIATHTNISKNIIDKIDETKIPAINLIIGDFFGKKYVNLSNYLKNLKRVMSSINDRGYAVVVGRGSNFLIPESLKIRIITDMEKRIKNVMKFRKVSREKAIIMINSSDKKRSEFTKQLFKHSNKNPYHYDVVFKTGSLLDDEEVVSAIVQMAKRKFNI